VRRRVALLPAVVVVGRSDDDGRTKPTTGAPGPTGSSGVVLDGAHDITISGLTIGGNEDPSSRAVSVNGASSNIGEVSPHTSRWVETVEITDDEHLAAGAVEVP
jgi:hypothetical protein